MRITNVKKSQKDPGRCGKCGTELKKGDAYRWIKFRFGGKRIRCTSSECRFRGSDMTTSDKVSNIFSAGEQIEDKVKELRDNMPDVAVEGWSAWLNELADVIAESIGQLEETAEGYEESASNLDEHFPGSQQVDDCNEKAYHCQELAQTLETVESSVRTTAEEDTDTISWSDIEGVLDEVDNATCDIQPY